MRRDTPFVLFMRASNRRAVPGREPEGEYISPSTSILARTHMDASSRVTTDHAGVMVPPPLIYVLFFLAGVVLQRYVPIAQLPSWTLLLAPVLIASWLLLTVWSFRRFWGAGTSVVPVRPSTTLVIEGPYRLTRNPMYVGLLFLYLGVTCWSGLTW